MRRDGGAVDADDKRRALDLVPVSRETEQRLEVYVDRLRRWQAIKNLVAPSTLDQIWTRHVADSAQVLALAPPGARRWADLGSGAGFPGLVLGIMLAAEPDARVHLIESNARKCAFLRDVILATSAAAEVHNGRIEDVLPTLKDVDVITARALAPLPVLLELGKLPLSRGASAIFLKSKAEAEYAALGDGIGRLRLEPSRTSDKGRIVVIRPVSHTDIGAGLPHESASNQEGSRS